MRAPLPDGAHGDGQEGLRRGGRLRRGRLQPGASCRGHDFNRPERREVEPDLDAIVELYFRDEQSMRAAFARPQMARMFDDHPNFMDTDTAANVRIYEVEESVFVGSRTG